MYSFKRTEGWYDGLPVASGLTPSKPSSLRPSASTNASITLTGLSSLIQSSRHSGRSVDCVRSVPSTKRFILPPRIKFAKVRESRQPNPQKHAFSHSQGHLLPVPVGCGNGPVFPKPAVPSVNHSDRAAFAAPRMSRSRFHAHIRLGFNFSSKLVMSLPRQTQRPQLFSLDGIGHPLLPKYLLQARLGLLSLPKMVLSALFPHSLRRRWLVHRFPLLEFSRSLAIKSLPEEPTAEAIALH